MRENDKSVNGTEKQNVDAAIREFFQVPDLDAHTCPPLTLAYIGDAVYEMVIRTIVVGAGKERVRTLHQHTSHLVKAGSQSAMLEYLFPVLTEEEHAVYRRGRNAHAATKAKNATIVEYRRATGFEALMGYLYLTGRSERMLVLIRTGLTGLANAEKEEKTKKGKP